MLVTLFLSRCSPHRSTACMLYRENDTHAQKLRLYLCIAFARANEKQKKKHVKNHIIFSLKWNNVTNRQKTSWHSKDECFTAHINRIKCVRASYGAVDLIPIFVAMSRHKCSNPCSKFVSCVLFIFFCSLAIFFPFGRRPIKMNRHKMKTLKILHRFTRTSTYFGHAHWGT